ncbi:hypothetical protein [Aeromonas caviae]|uniref:hypothetical protein n=1 Tax=Aeromonas caviae TaxID=648 RepID=UPI0029DDDDFB|nr:hypothetical protein [Aeromonas caviae]MDX7716410.1 hypothetical protein [Aeromonas caviae]
MLNKKVSLSILLSLALTACGGGGGDDSGSNGGNTGGNTGNGVNTDNGGSNTAAPTISVTAISKTGTIYGGEQFDLTYTVADADTATSNLIVSAVADSSAVSVNVDTATKKVLVTSSVVTEDTSVNIELTVSDGKNSSKATYSVTLASYSAEYNELISAMATMKGILTGKVIQKEDVNTVTALGTIAMTKGAITADDVEITKQGVITANSNFTSTALAQLASYESALATSPSSAVTMLPTFNNWKDDIMSSFAPEAFNLINRLAQKAGVVGLANASVSDANLLNNTSRFVGRQGYLDNTTGLFQSVYQWMYTTEDGKRSSCSI